jgi:hypothetical protein
LPQNIALLVGAEKHLLNRPKWDYDSDPRYIVFTAPLDLVDGTITGFELRAKVDKNYIGRNALMQLEFAKTARDRIELSRCQWRPFEVHQNKNWGPPGHELRRFYRESHHHTFEHNYLPAERRMRAGSLPGAVPINPDPSTLSDFIAFCGECFRIKNINVINLPNVNADLFWVPL